MAEHGGSSGTQGGNEGNMWQKIGSAIITGGSALLSGGGGPKRRYKYAKKLAALELANQKELNEFNNKLALQMWKDTNYSAQVAELRKAGLSTGLMYDMPGHGGSTDTGAGGNVSAPVMPETGNTTGMALIQAMQAKAQTDLVKAQTENVKADTAKKSGVDTEKAGAEIEQLKQMTTNARVQQRISELQEDILEIDKNLKNETLQTIITKTNAEMWKVIGEAESAQAKGKVDKATTDELIKQTRQYTTEQQIRMAAMKEGIEMTKAQVKETFQAIENLRNDREIDWKNLSVKEREVKVKEKMGEFYAGDTAEAQRLQGMVMQLVTLGMGGSSGGQPIGFQY